MNNFKLPLTPIEVEKYLLKVLGYNIDFNLLYSIYTTKNAGSSLNDLLTITTFNELYAAIVAGNNIKCVTTNKSINILAVECEEIASDDFKYVEINFYHDGKLITLGFSKFGSDVFLDGKTIKEV